MEKMKRLDKPMKVLVVIAIASTSMSVPTLAATDITTSQDWQLAQASLVGQCRATKQPIPVFASADATSAALRLLSANEEVTLSDASVDVNGFIGINTPATGYVHAVNLKSCTGGTVPPGNKSLCRQVARPPQGLVIRREPSTTAAVVDSLAYLGRVTLTTNPPTARRVNDRDWVEVAAPARGWVSNGLVVEPQSNLVYCQ